MRLVDLAKGIPRAKLIHAINLGAEQERMKLRKDDSRIGGLYQEEMAVSVLDFLCTCHAFVHTSGI